MIVKKQDKHKDLKTKKNDEEVEYSLGVSMTMNKGRKQNQ